MPTKLLRSAPPLVGTSVLLASGAFAWGQGYTVAEADGRIEDRPANAARLAFDAPATSAVVTLPFRFWYFGEPHQRIVVSAHRWVLPGAPEGFAEGGDPTAAHGQDPTTGAFPYGRGGASADGVIAPLWTEPSGENTTLPAVFTWTSGAASARRFVVAWESPRRTVQLHLHEGPGRIVFAYRTAPTTGAPGGTGYVCGIDEPGGGRFATQTSGPRHEGMQPATDLVFDPRTVLANPPGIGKEGRVPRWEDVRKESTIPDGCTNRCTYLARGHFYFSVPDRALFHMDPKHGRRKHPPKVLDALLGEDRATFGGRRGDAGRWIRQVLDGKMIFVPARGGAPLRVWFRIIEYYTLDNRGLTKPDYHFWNLRRMLSNAFPGADPRERIGGYSAWKAMAVSRLTVGKLFHTDQPDDHGKQFDSGRKNEYLLWAGRLRTGTRGALPKYATPGDGWVRFFLQEDGEDVEQHAEKRALRFVPDPNYVDGHFEYTIRAPDNPHGWITGNTVPPPPVRDEPFDFDPGRRSGPETPR